MLHLLNKIQKNLTIAIPVFMILGFIFGLLFTPLFLKKLIVPFTFMMVYPMMVNLQFRKLLLKGNTSLQLMTQVINFGIIPFIALFLGKIFFPNNPLFALGLLLTALLPTSGMTISWTGFAKGNITAAIKMTIFGLIIGSLATPFYANWLMGTVVTIPMVNTFKQIAIVIFLPMIAGALTQHLIIAKYGMSRYQNGIKQLFPPFSTIGILGIVFVAMALKSKALVSQPLLLLSLLLPIILLYIINFSLSTLVGKYFFKRDDGIALVYGTVMRNLSIALAIAMTVFGDKGSDIALIIALAYIIQVQSAAWYVKFTNKIFGAPSS